MKGTNDHIVTVYNRVWESMRTRMSFVNCHDAFFLTLTVADVRRTEGGIG